MKLKITVLEGWNKKEIKCIRYAEIKESDASRSLFAARIVFMMEGLFPTGTKISLHIEKLSESAVVT